jgi:hypothetical protein
MSTIFKPSDRARAKQRAMIATEPTEALHRRVSTLRRMISAQLASGDVDRDDTAYVDMLLLALVRVEIARRDAELAQCALDTNTGVVA